MGVGWPWLVAGKMEQVTMAKPPLSFFVTNHGEGRLASDEGVVKANVENGCSVVQNTP